MGHTRAVPAVRAPRRHCWCSHSPSSGLAEACGASPWRRVDLWCEQTPFHPGGCWWRRALTVSKVASGVGRDTARSAQADAAGRARARSQLKQETLRFNFGRVHSGGGGGRLLIAARSHWGGPTPRGGRPEGNGGGRPANRSGSASRSSAKWLYRPAHDGQLDEMVRGSEHGAPCTTSSDRPPHARRPARGGTHPPRGPTAPNCQRRHRQPAPTHGAAYASSGTSMVKEDRQ
jgi:hypothetical protein